MLLAASDVVVIVTVGVVIVPDEKMTSLPVANAASVPPVELGLQSVAEVFQVPLPFTSQYWVVARAEWVAAKASISAAAASLKRWEPPRGDAEESGDTDVFMGNGN